MPNVIDRTIGVHVRKAEGFRVRIYCLISRRRSFQCFVVSRGAVACSRGGNVPIERRSSPIATSRAAVLSGPDCAGRRPSHAHEATIRRASSIGVISLSSRCEGSWAVCIWTCWPQPNQQFGITDDVDEKEIPDVQFDLFLRSAAIQETDLHHAPLIICA